jgi:hypothetical protein
MNYSLMIVQLSFQTPEINDMNVYKEWKKTISQREFRIIVREEKEMLQDQ